MPTVLRINGFSIVIYTDDHEPMHVHVRYQGRSMTIEIENEVIIRQNNMNENEARRAVRIVEENQEFLQKKWREVWQKHL